MATKKESTNNQEFNIAEVKPEFRKHDGSTVRIIDMGDNEIINAIDLLDSLIERRTKEIEKLSKIKEYLVLEYSMREGSHVNPYASKSIHQYA